MQQFVDPRQAEGLPEFLLENPLGVLCPQTAQAAIGFSRTGQEPLTELLLLFHR
jgi:hypothetical protein